MADTRVLEDAACGTPVLERNRYFYGKPMTVRDFEAEQLYALAKSRFLNRQLVGAGVICGLQASVPAKFDRNRPTITVSEGAALDCCGNLIVVSEDSTVEIKGLVQDGLNYLYISYDECVRQPVMASANVSSCAEVCCYNRIRETFTVTASTDAPFETTVTGSVSTLAGQNQAKQVLAGAKVEAVRNGLVKAATLTDSKGNYQLNVRSAGTYDLRVRRRGFADRSETKVLQKRQSLRFDVTLEVGVTSPPQSTIIGAGGGASARAVFQAGVAVTAPAPPPPTEAPNICSELKKAYFDEHLRDCSGDCADDRVFLAAIEVDKTGTATLRTDETTRYRPVVHSNPMLHELMCAHFADFDNPHRTTALQVGALRSINNVGNAGAITGVENITLASDGTVQIDPDPPGRKITLRTLAATSVSSVAASKRVGTAKSFAPEDHAHDLSRNVVAREHLSGDVITSLVASNDGSINVTPDDANKTISLSFNRTLLPKPATDVRNVKSVGAERQVGASTLYAREDHAHDIAGGVVRREHFNGDVIQNLLVPDTTILTTPNIANQTISISVNPNALPKPASDVASVKSVGAERRLGSSALFAREDHVHNLSLNEALPNTEGHLKLTAGSNISIKRGKDPNELVITGAAGGSRVTTGEFVFTGVASQAEITSADIAHGAGDSFVTFALAVLTTSGTLVSGVTQAFSDSVSLPSLMTVYQPNSATFRIRLRDHRQTREVIDWRIRWWAIPAFAAAAQGTLLINPNAPPPVLREQPDVAERFEETRTETSSPPEA